MNERVKKLAEQARAQVHEIYKTMEEEPIGNFIDWFDEQFEQKFAELIVNECLDIVDIEVPGMIGVHAMKKISEHFGVE